MDDKPGAQWMIINLKENQELMEALSKAGHTIDPNSVIRIRLAQSLLPQLPGFDLSPQPGRGETHPTDTVSRETKKMLEDLRQFAIEVIHQNKLSLKNMTHSIRLSYQTLYFMYLTMFGIGILTAIFAIIKGFTASSATDTYSTLIFAGLSAASFFGLFITRPLESLERNSIFSSWLIAVTNTYWTEYAYFDDAGTAYDDLNKATGDLVKELSALADKHAAAIGKYPALTTPDTKSSSSKTRGQDGKPDKSKP